jgi:hypothetical protein
MSSAFSLNHMHTPLRAQALYRQSILYKSIFDDMDTEDADSFRNLATNYVKAKYNLLNADSFENKAVALVRGILPPLSRKELAMETASLFSQNIDEATFLDQVVNNKYWARAGAVVVQELIYLDVLYNYYYNKKQLLNDEDYEELKNQLQWSGSDVSSMTGKEALFVTAVAAHRRGEALLDDKEYESLKQQLVNENSWVVKRGADALEKLGIDTFLGYLHRSLK